MKKVRVARPKTERATCKPTEHDFMPLDMTTILYPNVSAPGIQQHAYAAFCRKCGEYRLLGKEE